MNIAYIISEVTGIHKVGGLGDVGAALPKALSALGHDVKIFMPINDTILANHSWHEKETFSLEYAGKNRTISIYLTQLPATSLSVIGIYEPTLISAQSVSDASRYACWSLATLTTISHQYSQWRPEVLHAHDWHAALIPAIKHQFSLLRKTRTVFTIHNANFQGETQDLIPQELNLPPLLYSSFKLHGSKNMFNFMIQGIVHADAVTTVSPQYAKEILTPEYGGGINQIFKKYKHKLSGILNGIDTNFWNPQTDSLIFHPFQIDNYQQGKQQNKRALQSQLDLPQDSNAKLLTYIGRADAAQKGLQLIIELVRDYQLLTDPQIQLVILTKGDPWLEQEVGKLPRLPNLVIKTEFNEPLAHQLYAASDFSLIPSRYEPCGLIQMISMRYGTIPIARATGGLIDSIQDFSNGFLFQDYSSEQFHTKIKQILALPSTQLDEIARTGLASDWSWEKSARIYEKILKNSPQLTTMLNLPNIVIV